jgi:hypothetical protein
MLVLIQLLLLIYLLHTIMQAPPSLAFSQRMLIPYQILPKSIYWWPCSTSRGPCHQESHSDCPRALNYREQQCNTCSELASKEYMIPCTHSLFLVQKLYSSCFLLPCNLTILSLAFSHYIALCACHGQTSQRVYSSVAVFDANRSLAMGTTYGKVPYKDESWMAFRDQSAKS